MFRFITVLVPNVTDPDAPVMQAIRELKQDVMECARDVARFLDGLYDYLPESVHISANSAVSKLAGMLKYKVFECVKYTVVP